MKARRDLPFLLTLLAAFALGASPSTAQEHRDLRSAATTALRGYEGVRATLHSSTRDRGIVRRPVDLVRCATPPVRVWVPGCYDTVVRRVWVPERFERLWIEPVYAEHVDACGNVVRVMIRAGCWQEVLRPGHFETRSERVWVPGHWVLR